MPKTGKTFFGGPVIPPPAYCRPLLYVYVPLHHRYTFSADEYHNNEVTAATTEAADAWPPDIERRHLDVSTANDWRPSSIRDSDCWSCEAIDGSDYDDDDNEKNTVQPPPPPPSSTKWKRRLSRLFKTKRDRP